HKLEGPARIAAAVLVVDRELFERPNRHAGLAAGELTPDLSRSVVFASPLVLAGEVPQGASLDRFGKAHRERAPAGRDRLVADAGAIEDAAEAEEVKARLEHARSAVVAVRRVPAVRPAVRDHARQLRAERGQR